MRIKNIHQEDLKTITTDSENYVFGISDTGKKLVSRLLDKGVRVNGIWDNDLLKQGSKFENIPIISYDDLSSHSGFNLFIGCAYAIQEKEKINKLKDVKLYQVDTDIDLEPIYKRNKKYLSDYKKKTEAQREFYADDYSKETADILLQFFLNQDLSLPGTIATVEEHYFIQEVMDVLKAGMIYVDCGAFTGEFPYTLNRMGVEFNHCYCFEMEKNHCETAKENMIKLGLDKKVTIVNRAISDEDGYISFVSAGASSRIVECKTNQRIRSISLDSYFEHQKVDFIKMDIEGAELAALKGGIGLIKINRPILAISVYHSLCDRTDIFNYLRNNLKHYKYYLRHHTIWEGETVLYAIPGGGND